MSKQMSSEPRPTISLHGKTYQIPIRPTVVICVDGFDPTYLSRGIADGVLPTMRDIVTTGFHATSNVAMPTFTNPNNVSIITGVPTAVHGIAGNYFLDKETGAEIMVVDDTLLRGSTILAEMASHGVRIAAITAKDKLLRIIQHGLTGSANALCFSSEKVSDETLKWMSREAPNRYSGDLSLFVLDAGIKILQEKRADLLYLTLSDWIQHKHAPGEPEADEFMAAIDTRIKALINEGAVVGVTGDHGMSGKSKPDGSPNVLFLQDKLEEKFGAQCARVICPITDPFVKHHGALGGFVRVHVKDAHAQQVGDMVEFCASFAEVELALRKQEAADQFEMPLDREGDFVVVAKNNAVLGSKAAEHDLETLEGYRLRSHGGLSEQKVPLLVSNRLKNAEQIQARQLRNFDVFDLVLNYGQ